MKSNKLAPISKAEQMEIARRICESGQSISSVAAETGRHPRTIQDWVLCYRRKLDPTACPQRISSTFKERRAIAKQIYESGESVAKFARASGRPVKTLRNWFNAYKRELESANNKADSPAAVCKPEVDVNAGRFTALEEAVHGIHQQLGRVNGTLANLKSKSQPGQTEAALETKFNNRFEQMSEIVLKLRMELIAISPGLDAKIAAIDAKIAALSEEFYQERDQLEDALTCLIYKRKGERLARLNKGQ